MRKQLVYLFLFLFPVLLAQVPQGINYQGVARNQSGQAISKTIIAVQFKIWQGNPGSGGSLIYSETHNAVLTDTFGLYSLQIGSTSGSGMGAFSSIGWAGGNKWVEVYIDPTGGSSFQLVSSQQLMSVPYALYAETSGGGSASVSGQPNNIPRINNAGNGLGKSLIYQSTDSSSVGIGTFSPAPNAVLDISSSKKGILIPRIGSSQRTSGITNPNHGLLVFQRDNGGVTSPQGFWYYDSLATAWLYVAPAQAVWTLSGNYLTNPGSHYVGTADDKDLVFKTGTTSFTPVERMRILNNTNGGNVQFGNVGAGTHYTFPAAKGNPGEVLQMDPANTNKIIWAPFSGAYWARTGGKLFPATITDTIGIGTSSPQAALDIHSANNSGALNVVSSSTTTPAVLISTSNASNGYVALDVNSSASSTADAINATSASGYALSGVSANAPALWVKNNSSNYSTIEAQNTGGHSAAYFHNSVTNGTAPTLVVSTTDPNNFSASFSGGLGVSVDNLRISGTSPQPGYVLASVNTNGDVKWQVPPLGLPPPGNGHILYDSMNVWKPSIPTNLFFNGAKMGIGTATPATQLHVKSTAANGAVTIDHAGSGPALLVNVAAGSSSPNAIQVNMAGSSASAAGISAINTGSGNAGAFSINSSTNSAPALYATTNGASGYALETFVPNGVSAVGIASFNNGNGHAILGNASGGGDGVNGSSSGSGNAVSGAVSAGPGNAGNFLISSTTSSADVIHASHLGQGSALNANSMGNMSTITSTNTGPSAGAGSFQIQNISNPAPALAATTNGTGPALRVTGPGAPASAAAIFTGGAVAMGTTTPTSGVDMKTSVAISVKKYATAGSITITLADPNVVHMPTTSGTFTFVLPDATMCPGRLLIFTTDNSVTGGTVSLTPCCGQNVNGSGNFSFSMMTGSTKPSYGILSDGANWQIIFKN